MMDTEDIMLGCASCRNGKPDGHIDVGRVIERLDALYDRDDLPGAGRLLRYWRDEAVRVGDKRGELSIVSEQMGYYRKTGEEDKGLEAVKHGLELINALDIAGLVSAGTVYLNAATTMKAFGQSEQALPVYEKAKAVYMAGLDGNDPRFAGFYNNYALALADVGRHSEAEEAYLKAISIMEQAPDGKPDAAISYLNLAQLYGETEGKTGEDMQRCMDLALQCLRDREHPRNGYYYFVLSKCAPAYRDYGYDEIADELEEQVMAYHAGT